MAILSKELIETCGVHGNTCHIMTFCRSLFFSNCRSAADSCPSPQDETVYLADGSFRLVDNTRISPHKFLKNKPLYIYRSHRPLPSPQYPYLPTFPTLPTPFTFILCRASLCAFCFVFIHNDISLLFLVSCILYQSGESGILPGATFGWLGRVFGSETYIRLHILSLVSLANFTFLPSSSVPNL